MHQRLRKYLWICAGAVLLGACADNVENRDRPAARAAPGVTANEITIGRPFICDIARRAKTWRMPVRLGTDFGSVGFPPEVATSANGNAMVVWLEYSGGSTFNVKASRYAAPPGGLLPSWQAAPDVIGTYDYQASGNYTVMPPALAMDDNGGAIVIWPEYVGTTSYTIQARRFTPATGWEAVTPLGSSAFNFPPIVDVAMDGAGNAIAVWERHEFPSSIDYARFTPGGGWGGATALENSAGMARFPGIAASSNGTVVAAWIQTDVEPSVYARRFVPAAGWGAITRIDSAIDGLDANHPRVAMKTAGRAAVSWIAESASGTASNLDVYANVVDAAGGWAGASMLAADVVGSPWVDHSIAIDDLGNAVAAWNGEAAGQINVYARRILPGGSPDASTRLLDLSNDPALYPEIGMDANGNGIVVWLQLDGTNKSIYARHLAHRLPSPGCAERWSWGSVHIHQAADRIFQRPRIAMYTGGSAVAAWKTFDDAGTESVYAMLYR